MIVLFALVVSSFCAKNFTTAGAAVSWTGFVAINTAVFPLQTPPSLPYQILEDFSSASTFYGDFDFTNNASLYVNMALNQCEQQLTLVLPSGLRADCGVISPIQIVFSVKTNRFTWHTLVRSLRFQRLSVVNQSSEVKTINVFISASGMEVLC